MAVLTSELVRLNNLQLAGKIISDQVTLGIHSSRRSGSGTEFEQYRHYQPGDDLKKIDWKLYARSGKHLVKESATESNLHIRMMLDLSGSSNYTENGLSRLHFYKILLASFAWLGYRQSDAMSLYSLHEGNLSTLVSPGKGAFQRILYTLEQAEASGTWMNTAPAFPELSTKHKELILLASDLLNADEGWLQLVRNIAGPQREILIFQVLGREETDFDLKGFYRFKDLETGRETELEASVVKAGFRKSMENYLSELEEALKMPHVYLVRAALNEPVADVITRSLKILK